MTRLSDIEGIGETYATKLQECGIPTQENLLEKGSTVKGRAAIAKDTGLSPKLVSKWVNRADLARVKGIGAEYADLLQRSGVDTVPELAQRNPANLHEKLTAVNTEKKLVRSLPTLSRVEAWVAQATNLPRSIRY